MQCLVSFTFLLLWAILTQAFNNDLTTVERLRLIQFKAPRGLLNMTVKKENPVAIVREVSIVGHNSHTHVPVKGSRNTPVQITSAMGTQAANTSLTKNAIDPSCLKPLLCYHEDYIDYNHLEIHHWDLSERSAAACGHLCMSMRPSSQLVFCKMIEMNERLVCGCGDYSAILPGGEMNSFLACSLCPDGTQSCGSATSGAINIYDFDRQSPSCLMQTTDTPVVTVTTPIETTYHGTKHLGCYNENTIQPPTTDKYLDSQRLDDCIEHCNKMVPNARYYLTKYRPEHTDLYCGCGGEEMISGVSSLFPSSCSSRCPDGGHICGGQNTLSVYNRSPGHYPSFLAILTLLSLSWLKLALQ